MFLQVLQRRGMISRQFIVRMMLFFALWCRANITSVQGILKLPECRDCISTLLGQGNYPQMREQQQ